MAQVWVAVRWVVVDDPLLDDRSRDEIEFYVVPPQRVPDPPPSLRPLRTYWRRVTEHAIKEFTADQVPRIEHTMLMMISRD